MDLQLGCELLGAVWFLWMWWCLKVLVQGQENFMVVVRNKFMLKGLVGKTDRLTSGDSLLRSESGLINRKTFSFPKQSMFPKPSLVSLTFWKCVFIHLCNCLCVLHCHSLAHTITTPVWPTKEQKSFYLAHTVSSENEPKFGFIHLWCTWTPVPEENVAALNTS